MTTPSSDGRKRHDARLLVVEDEPNILELLAASLRYAGFEVITASAGTEAVQAAGRHRPDLIVLDVMLPDMDGFDVIRRLRGGGTRIPVVFLTARDAMEDKVRGLTLGGDDYVTKPFSLEEVIARIRAVLRRTRGDAAEPTPRLKFADLELDEDSHEVWRAGVGLRLPRRHRDRRVLRVRAAPQGGQRRAAADPHPARRRVRAQASFLVAAISCPRSPGSAAAGRRSGGCPAGPRCGSS
jgi:DNA-binding response OmpR family regulator